MNLADIRSRLSGLEGRTYWRSLEELADTPEFREYLHREFPAQASEFTDPAGRRQFLKLMGASLALAGVSACTRQPEERIVPYVRQPEELVPGRPLFFATAMPLGGFGQPLLVESHMGRPTKIEGNPEHPASLGATDLFAQAAVLSLYDPDRSRNVLNRGEVKTWSTFLAAVQAIVTAQKAIKGAALRLLTEPITSPTLVEQIQHAAHRLSRGEVASVGSRLRRAPGRRGRPRRAIYDLDKADVVVSLDADFLGFGPASVRYTKDFSARRRMGTPKDALNRLYVVGAVPTVTGGKADHRLALKARDVHAFAAAVAAARRRIGGRPARRRRSPLGDGAVLGDGRGRGSPGAPRPFGRHRGRSPAGGRARARARHQRGARQRRRDGDLHDAAARVAGRRRGVALRARRGHGGRQGRRARSSSAATRSSPRRPI